MYFVEAILFSGRKPMNDCVAASKHEYERWKISTFTYWAVYLHAEHPNYLGRLYIWLLRDEADLMDVTLEEREELFLIGSRLKMALRKLFQVDCFNWAALGNSTPHCHVHVIPRYKTKRVYQGEVFCDYQWGKNYAPYDIKFAVPERVLETMRDEIALELATESLC